MKWNAPYFMSLAFALGAVGCVLVLAGPEFDTAFGPVRGVWLWTAKAAEIAGFLGIPYAEPPLGELRFENPRPWTRTWNTTRDATGDGPMCLQKSATKAVVGREDCLYLNIFTPLISKPRTDLEPKKLSVLVFIHGGGFRTGSSNSSLFAPTYLLDHDIILVTLNYRLNVLGFFSTGSDVTPGNYGLKDIAVALAWIRDNIGAFGGDATSVTLAGFEAGAVAAQILAARVNASDGLFHKLITVSGTATSHWAVNTRSDLRSSSLHVATLVGCTGRIDSIDDSGSGELAMDIEELPDDYLKNVMECMKKVDATTIVEQGDEHVWQRHPMLIFTPTLEAEAEGAILTVHPERSLGEGLFRDMPWIIGVTDDEGLWKTTDFLLNGEIRDTLVEDYENLLVPYVLEMKNTIDNITAATAAINDFYFKGDILSNFAENITQLVGDALVMWSSYEFLQKQTENMKSDMYFYVFAYEGTFSNTFRWGIPFRFGAAHGDDINYVFPYLNAKYADLELSDSFADRVIINTMCEIWISFIKTGVPSAHLTPRWEPYRENHRFMRFGKSRLTDREMEGDFLPERMAFWSELLKNFSVPIEEYQVGDKDAADDDEDTGSSRASVRYLPGASYIAVPFLWMSSTFLLQLQSNDFRSQTLV